jgi:hypothetical protein
MLLLLLIIVFILSIVNGNINDIQKWREEYQPQLIDPLDNGLQYEYKKEYVYIYSYDKKNNPVIYFNVSNYDKNDRNLTDVKKLSIYILDSALKLSNDNKFIIIVDLEKFTIKKTLDFDMVIMVLNILQSSEMLDLAIAINSPFIFKTAWNIIQNFLTTQTKTKVKFYNKKDLINIVDYENLPLGFQNQTYN